MVGEIEGGLGVETRVSTTCCERALRQAWLQGEGCAQELWEEQAAKVQCVCWVEGSPGD